MDFSDDTLVEHFWLSFLWGMTACTVSRIGIELNKGLFKLHDSACVLRGNTLFGISRQMFAKGACRYSTNTSV
jgi:hypothetical protein